MTKKTTQRKTRSGWSFFTGFGSVINISGPTSKEFFSIRDHLQSASIKDAWKEVGNNISRSIKSLDQEIANK